MFRVLSALVLVVVGMFQGLLLWLDVPDVAEPKNLDRETRRTEASPEDEPEEHETDVLALLLTNDLGDQRPKGGLSQAAFDYTTRLNYATEVVKQYRKVLAAVGDAERFEKASTEFEGDFHDRDGNLVVAVTAAKNDIQEAETLRRQSETKRAAVVSAWLNRNIKQFTEPGGSKNLRFPDVERPSDIERKVMGSIAALSGAGRSYVANGLRASEDGWKQWRTVLDQIDAVPPVPVPKQLGLLRQVCETFERDVLVRNDGESRRSILTDAQTLAGRLVLANLPELPGLADYSKARTGLAARKVLSKRDLDNLYGALPDGPGEARRQLDQLREAINTNALLSPERP
jgi:hypothetical protein